MFPWLGRFLSAGLAIPKVSKCVAGRERREALLASDSLDGGMQGGGEFRSIVGREWKGRLPICCLRSWNVTHGLEDNRPGPQRFFFRYLSPWSLLGIGIIPAGKRGTSEDPDGFVEVCWNSRAGFPAVNRAAHWWTGAAGQFALKGLPPSAAAVIRSLRTLHTTVTFIHWTCIVVGVGCRL